MINDDDESRNNYVNITKRMATICDHGMQSLRTGAFEIKQCAV